MSEFDDIPRADLEKLIRTNLVWDMMAHEDAPEMLVRLGITPPSEEGQRVASEASHKRMALVNPLLIDFAYMSEEISRIITAVILGDAAKDIDEEIVDQLTRQTTVILDAGSRVMVANFIAAEILQIRDKAKT